MNLSITASFQQQDLLKIWRNEYQCLSSSSFVLLIILMPAYAHHRALSCRLVWVDDVFRTCSICIAWRQRDPPACGQSPASLSLPVVPFPSSCDLRSRTTTRTFLRLISLPPLPRRGLSFPVSSRGTGWRWLSFASTLLSSFCCPPFLSISTPNFGNGISTLLFTEHNT